MALAMLGTVLCVTGCRKDNDMADQGAGELYEIGKRALDTGAWDRAVRAYKSLQTRYPFGRYTEQSMLDLSYAYFKRGDPENALSNLDRFIRTYPPTQTLTMPTTSKAWSIIRKTWVSSKRSCRKGCATATSRGRQIVSWISTN